MDERGAGTAVASDFPWTSGSVDIIETNGRMWCCQRATRLRGLAFRLPWWPTL